MLVTTREIFEKCYGRYAVAAVNVEFMEQVHAVFAAAQRAQAPVIVQTTPVARDYAHAKMLASMVRTASEIYPGVVYAFHVDHGYESHIDDALESGAYTSVMIDASHDEFEKNASRTRAVVEKAHAKGVSVEAELGTLGGVEDDITVDEKKALYTDPEQVEEFVKLTACDSLAVAVGTSHGAYKFSGGQGLQFDILEGIQKRLPGFPLVLHGGSAVNTTEIERINEAGGKLSASAKGVDAEEIKRSIKYGVCKVNIATDARLMWTRVTREFFASTPEDFTPIKPGKTYMEEYASFLTEKFEMLGSAGKAGEFLSKG
ncbi:fructose-1,6-bisphosphate aldolase, class II [Fulvitalea axinellae]|uniref:Fructose-1,6-bisphosphate aldolase, class II n=1 Tax=Fulvitalea axinellae TaxID=1182444 RepID=A0AAU9CH56_9BACT|nr:fructose-1,6-bisphosphate aldolase, class II [Fulvitalea axinellae]